jgi:hypothetical protein
MQRSVGGTAVSGEAASSSAFSAPASCASRPRRSTGVRRSRGRQLGRQRVAGFLVVVNFFSFTHIAIDPFKSWRRPPMIEARIATLLAAPKVPNVRSPDSYRYPT